MSSFRSCEEVDKTVVEAGFLLFIILPLRQVILSSLVPISREVPQISRANLQHPSLNPIIHGCGSFKCFQPFYWVLIITSMKGVDLHVGQLSPIFWFLLGI